MRELESIHAQLETSALTIEARARRVHDALSALAGATRVLRTTPADDAELASWVEQGGFVADATGFYERAQLLARVRAGADVRDEASWFWPSARKDDPVVRRRLHPLRALGPWLHAIHQQLPDAQWIYYQDAANVALVYPALDMINAIPPDFDWHGYHSFASVTVEADPERAVRWTPPNVDYGGKGLITCVSIPIDEDGALAGVWSIDLLVSSLHAGVALGDAERASTFIADRSGYLVAHPSIETLVEHEKGTLVRERVAALGGGFADVDVASIRAERGEREIMGADGRRLLLCHRVVPQLGWVLFATIPTDQLASVITHSFQHAFERIRHGDLSTRIDASTHPDVRDMADAFDAMADALERERRERDAAEGERRKLAERLAHAEKMQAIGQLAGGIAHDFNNFLTAVLAGTHYLARQNLDPKSQQLVSVILEAAERAAALTGQLLSFSRHQVVQLRVVDPAEALQHARALLARVAGDEIVLDLVAHEGHGSVLMDDGQLVQVALNLVLNARDAMPGGGNVRIEVEGSADGHDTILRVTDGGEGMTDAVRERIFEPLFTTKPGGTGLGLPTVRGIVEAAKGRIEVRSLPGHGSTFEITLPRHEGTTTVAATTTVVGGAETVLVVDDERLARNAMGIALGDAGYRTILAASAAEATGVLEQAGAGIALVVTDVVMAGEGGIELAARIRAHWPSIRVLCVSGYVAHADALPDGTAFLAKPFSPPTLLAKVRDVLDRRG